jgi:hypothetical protein
MSLLSGRARPFLPDRDYLPMAMPTTDIAVLQVLASTGHDVLRRYSTVGNVLVGDAPLPVIHSDSPVVDASGTRQRSAKAGIGLSVVSQILRALGADASLDLTASGAQTVEFAYTDVTADSVDLADLDRWLAGADFDPRARTTAELLATEEMYVVVNLLKARALSVRLVDGRSAGIALDLPAIAETIGSRVNITASTSADGTVTFHGTAPLGVAVKATQIRVDEQGFFLGSSPRIRGEVRPLNRRRTWMTGTDVRWREP